METQGVKFDTEAGGEEAEEAGGDGCVSFSFIPGQEFHTNVNNGS